MQLLNHVVKPIPVDNNIVLIMHMYLQAVHLLQHVFSSDFFILSLTYSNSARTSQHCYIPSSGSQTGEAIGGGRVSEDTL